MVKFRIKVNAAHPTGSINMRDSKDQRITVTAGGWTEVDEISPNIEVWRKYLTIEPIVKAVEKSEMPATKPKRKGK